jgi:putative SOS response-associated peptidase YedK
MGSAKAGYMCGRFVSARKRLELLEEFNVQRDRAPRDLEPDYNVAPTKQIYAITDSKEGERELRTLRWGLVPFWAKDMKVGAKMINARAETIAVKPAFRRPFAKRRCLIPADGYYEWKDKNPFYIFRTNGGITAMAGIYDLWRDPAIKDDDDDHAFLWTASIITTEATDDVGEIHNRMPMIIEPDLWADWLDPDTGHQAGESSQLQAAMVPAMKGAMTSYPVSTAVNFVRNNGPELIRPLPTGGEDWSGRSDRT